MRAPTGAAALCLCAATVAANYVSNGDAGLGFGREQRFSTPHRLHDSKRRRFVQAKSSRHGQASAKGTKRATRSTSLAKDALLRLRFVSWYLLQRSTYLLIYFLPSTLSVLVTVPSPPGCYSVYRRGGGWQSAAPAVPTTDQSQSTKKAAKALPPKPSTHSGKKHDEDPHGDMTVSTAILNMVADLCPHGMLPVAYGMAAAGGTGLVVAPALLAAFGIVSGYTMISIGRACEYTKRWSFSALWGDLVGKESAWVVEAAVALMCFGCCIFYSAFVGDLFGALAGSAGFVPSFFKKRAVDLITLTACPLLPLCLMKNLSALQYTSFFGVVSILYTVCFVVKRSLDGSYADGGAFFQAIDPKFRSPVTNPWGTVNLWRVGPGIVTLMNMACVAFMAHYNGVKYYEELENRSVKKYTTTIGTAMTVSLGVFCTMMLFGFRTFGPAAQALILNNYHRTADPLASMARLATGCSILCGYPLMFAALKSSFFNAAAEISSKFGDGGQKLADRFLSDEGLRTGCILSLLLVITTVACNQSEEDVAVIVGLIGALLGSAANYIIPAVLNISLLRRMGAKQGLLSEVSLNKLIIVFGFVFMVMGTAVTLRDAGAHGGGHGTTATVM